MINYDTINVGNIICPVCNISKSISEYPKDSSHKHGFRNTCKNCHSSENRETHKFKYHSVPEYKEKVKNWQKKYYLSKKPYMRKYDEKKKLLNYFGGKCSLCDYSKCLAALEFHHKDPKEKEFNISNISVSTDSWDKCIEEASKCILICNRCHREIHHLESQELYESMLNESKSQTKDKGEKPVSGI